MFSNNRYNTIITTDLFIIDSDYYYIFPKENMYSYYYS